MNRMRASTRHPQSRVRLGAGYVHVDRGIAGLLRAIWRLGIETMFSCEEFDHGRTQIGFPTTRDAIRWLNVVREHVDVEWSIDGTPYVGDAYAYFRRAEQRQDAEVEIIVRVYFPRRLRARLERTTRSSTTRTKASTTGASQRPRRRAATGLDLAPPTNAGSRAELATTSGPTFWETVAEPGKQGSIAIAPFRAPRNVAPLRPDFSGRGRELPRA